MITLDDEKRFNDPNRAQLHRALDQWIDKLSTLAITGEEHILALQNYHFQVDARISSHNIRLTAIEDVQKPTAQVNLRFSDDPRRPKQESTSGI